MPPELCSVIYRLLLCAQPCAVSDAPKMKNTITRKQLPKANIFIVPTQITPASTQVISISLSAECPVSFMCFCASLVPAPIQPHPGTSQRRTKSVVSV